MRKTTSPPGPTTQPANRLSARQPRAPRSGPPPPVQLAERVWPWLRFLLVIFSLGTGTLHAQQPDFQTTDSLISTLANQYRWAELDSVGRAQLRLGTDYPDLRRRLGQAALAQDRPAAAIHHYGHALRENPLDTTARYGLALAYLELNQPNAAALIGHGLPDSLRRPLHLNGFQLLSRVEVEGSVQFPDNRHRGTAGFFRVGLGTRLSPRFTFSQNLSFFGQDIELPDRFRRGASAPYPVRQTQYHALLGTQLAPRWRALLGGHYLSSDFGRVEAISNYLGYAAVAYARPYWAVQAGLYAGRLTDTTRFQTDLRLTVYPFGNLRLYGFGQASVVRSGGRSFPHGLLGAGGYLHCGVWLEAYGGLGQVPVLAELDGLYVYNLLDPLRARAGTSLLLLLPQRLSLRLGYGFERRRDFIRGNRYNLHSLSTALAWTW
ncbi:tetratricopeptide repeat protein [Hymenobacter negativus]|uniref:Tetratricopeptide repeat protein n=1 Tax=Hymenobacter negativus TaxID=2795026 RepID=A0ABS3QFL0_9BACT|nr:bacterial transcriptional activator domain-containing protein [Hymenobacter negativus]MBO2010040.1 tetratricopeptide repeat protein [Hymenobacter negativus]